MLHRKCDHGCAALAPYVVTTSNPRLKSIDSHHHHRTTDILQATTRAYESKSTMASSCDINERVPCPSRLLRLPRELRELIYEHALVRCTIPIECAVVRGPGYRKHSGYPCAFSPQLHEAFPLTRKAVHRRTWSLPIYDLDVDIQGGTWMEPKRAQMTYQLGTTCARPNHARQIDGITLQLFQVCRTIHDEARPLFYKKNTFSFTAKFPVSTALAFIQDLSPTALPLLSSIEMVLTEDNNMRGTAEAHYPPTTRSSDCLVLQHAFHYFTGLCDLLASSAVQLRELHLTIESQSSYGDSQPQSLSECLTWEIEKSGSPRPWVASWIHPLLKIRGLESVKIYWISDRPRLHRMSDTLSTMQQSMLKRADLKRVDSGASGGEVHSAHGHELVFSILKSHCDRIVTTLIFGPHTRDLVFGDCSCEDQQTGLEHVPTGFPGPISSFYKCGRATWKEHQASFTGFKGAYTAYCELVSTSVSHSGRWKSSTCSVHIDD